MFKKIQNGIGMAQQLSKLKSAQDRITKLLSSLVVVGYSDNKKVELSLNGNREIVDIVIDPSLVEFEYTNFTSQGKPAKTLTKSIIEAYKKALVEVEKKSAELLKESGGLDDFKGMLDMLG